MAELKRFEPDEIQLTQEEAWHVLRFFWPNTNVPPGSLSPEDRGFAQGLMIEAVERSYAMGYVESLYRSFVGPGVAPTSSALKKAIKSFAKKAIKNWFRHASGKDLEDPKIYESVRRSLARNFRSVWEIRAQTGELTY